MVLRHRGKDYIIIAVIIIRTNSLPLNNMQLMEINVNAIRII